MFDPSGKGKGKGRADASPGSEGAPAAQPRQPSAPSRSTFALPIPSARDLAGLLSAGGKAPAGLAGTAGGAAAQEWSADARATAGVAGGSGAEEAGRSFRTDAGGTQGNPGLDADFQDFLAAQDAGPMAVYTYNARPQAAQRPRTELPPSLLVGPYASASALDPGFHASVRAEQRILSSAATETEAFEAAWTSGSESDAARARKNHEMGAAWARAELVDVDDEARQAAEFGGFMAALAMDEAVPAPMAAPALPAQALPPGLSTTWRPPSPSRPKEMTLEQLKMHQDLAIAQDDELRTLPAPAPAAGSAADAHLNALGSRAAQALVPPQDDAAAQTGVYALTPELAFEAIWDGAGTAERAREEREKPSSTLSEEQFAFQSRASRAIREVTMWIARGTYVDDVYGLPPLLARTIAEADQPASANPDAEAMRLRAVERLEALTRHLSTASSLFGVHEAESWLRRQ